VKDFDEPAAKMPRTLIATHEGADFDALASGVAARKLYPDATLALPSSVGREVHPYLALHRELVRGLSLLDVPWSSIDRLVLVDVRSAARLRHIAPLLERRAAAPRSLELVIYDHHPARADDLAGDEEHIAKVGSTTTLLIEDIAAAGIPLDRAEATLLALGIHSDTGSLAFPGTTSRDAAALAFLLRSGVELDVLARYLHASVSPEQRSLLALLVTEREPIDIGGFSVGVCAAPVRAGTAGLDEVTTRAHELLGWHALFALYEQQPDKIRVVARSRSRHIDAAQALAPFGGGGHAGGATAVVRHTSVGALREAIIARLRAEPRQVRTARELMASPAHTVTPETPLVELGRCLSEWRETGACVVRDGRVIAVIARSDLERARRLGQLDLRVKSFMSGQLLTSAPEDSLEQMIDTMQTADIGRLPVIEQGRLIGVVRRSDVLRALYPLDPEPTAGAAG
jgi:tRNA nucleotidyltransferase (CCA-adding enzyme)